MVKMHCQLSFRGSRQYKFSYFGHKISTLGYFYGGNLVQMGVCNQAKEYNAHLLGGGGDLSWKEKLNWTKNTYVGKHYKLSNDVPCSNRGRKAVQIKAVSWKGFLVLLLGTQLPAEFSTQQISMIHVTFLCKEKRIRTILSLNHWMREACTK